MNKPIRGSVKFPRSINCVGGRHGRGEMIDDVFMPRWKSILGSNSVLQWYDPCAHCRRAVPRCIIEPTWHGDCHNQLAIRRWGYQMNNGLAQILRRARSPKPHEIARLSKRIAVLERRLSVLRTELQIAGRNNRSKIGLKRPALCARRPIAGRYLTPAESGNRRASSRT